MALPTNPVEREARLMVSHRDINRLANWLQDNAKDEIHKANKSDTAVDIALRILESNKNNNNNKKES